MNGNGTPLKTAATNNLVSIVELLLSKNASIADEYNPIFDVILADAVEVLEVLITNGVNLTRTANEFSPLMFAAGVSGEAIVQRLMDAKVPIDYKTSDGLNALIVSVTQDNVDAFKIILNGDPDLNSVFMNYSVAKYVAERGEPFLSIFDTHLKKKQDLDPKRMVYEIF